MDRLYTIYSNRALVLKENRTIKKTELCVICKQLKRRRGGQKTTKVFSLTTNVTKFVAKDKN